MTTQGEVATEAGSGDRRRTLVALRDRIAAAIDICEPKDLAALSRQLVSVTAEIEDMTEPEGGSLADQLAARRAHRLTTADEAGRPRTG